MHRSRIKLVIPTTARKPTGLLLWALFACAALVVGAQALGAGPRAAEVLVERGRHAMRADPDASRRDAEAALAVLAREPNADLEIRARILLCDYYAERDANAAR